MEELWKRDFQLVFSLEPRDTSYLGGTKPSISCSISWKLCHTRKLWFLLVTNTFFTPQKLETPALGQKLQEKASSWFFRLGTTPPPVWFLRVPFLHALVFIRKTFLWLVPAAFFIIVLLEIVKRRGARRSCMVCKVWNCCCNVNTTCVWALWAQSLQRVFGEGKL